MDRRTISSRVARIMAIGIVAGGAGSASAEETGIRNGDEQLGPVFTLSLGGKLYDDAWAILDIPPPTERNPAYPDKTVPVRDTWRCASCHGWDYAGSEGERGRAVKGLEAPSLKPLVGTEPGPVVDKILEPNHPFPTEGLSDLSLYLLAAFITDGQYPQERILDAKGRATGDPKKGRDIFEGACINCHQLDGRAFLKGEAGDRSSLGWITRNRPEQALHKIMNGVPMAEMLALRFLSAGEIADLLAYVQTIDPTEQE